MSDFMKIYGTLVSPARLMAPQEVQNVLTAKRGGPHLRRGWCLCGDITESMFDLLIGAQRTLRLRLTGFFGSAQGSYAVLTQQVHDLQHRFVLPLYEPDVLAFLNSLRHNPLQTMLGRGGGELAVVGQESLQWRDLVPLVAMARPSTGVNIQGAIMEAAEVVHHISRLDAIPSLIPEFTVRVASISYLPPSDFFTDMITGAVGDGVHLA